MSGRLSDARSVAVVVAAAARTFLRSAAERDWAADNTAPHPDPLSAIELPTILAQTFAADFSTVVEIGCWNGARIISLKNSRAGVRAIGMDIGQWFNDAVQTAHGVEFVRYDPQKIPRDALVISIGTLTCMQTSEVTALLRRIAENNNSLFYFEPTALFSVTKSIERKSPGTFFHPYRALAAATGLKPCIPAERNWPHGFSLKNLLRWEYQLLAPVHQPSVP